MMTLWVDADCWGSTKDYLAADVFGLIADYGVDAGKRGSHWRTAKFATMAAAHTLINMATLCPACAIFHRVLLCETSNKIATLIEKPA